MAGKTYKLTFEMTDGTNKEVQFTAPQGPQGDPGPQGPIGETGATGQTGAAGVGIVDISITEV